MSTINAAIRLSSRQHPQLARVTQIFAMLVWWYAWDALSRALGLPIPGSILALGSLLLLLLSGCIHHSALRLGADWLLANMLLFFVPAVMAIWKHLPLVRLDGPRIFAVILISTAMVMVATALLVDMVFRLSRRREAQRAVAH
ncbi:CidA/LrgA family protein [Solimonas marina]|uniref:CidA/LrgA family protein n=1 Tax=Solimonas marina TaxID=2714601 RepID=A0A969WA10_9GAMM|nr:CidA/LrgA family protein [Solimonas marina]NKF23112.1 CidA/LrgA family protein [Solimonas marina]